MMLQTKRVIELWNLRGELTKSRLGALCEHFASVYNVPEFASVFYAEALEVIPACQFED